MNNFSKLERGHGDCWMHNSKPVWVVEYSATRSRACHWQAYKAVQPVPKGRQPWTVDNRRIGPDDGFTTLDAAQAAGEAA